MFSACENLETIYASLDFDTSAVEYSGLMFNGCTKLVGGNGTAYNAEATDVEMASVDGYEGASYFTLKEGLSEGWKLCGSCQWYVDESGKLIISPLTGETEGTLATWDNVATFSPWKGNTSIKSVEVKEGVKAQTCAGMFEGCTNLASVDIAKLDTSDVTSTVNMFKDCTKLETVDLSKLNVGKVTNISEMFSGCTALTAVPTGFTIPDGATATNVFYIDSEEPVVIKYDGINEAITGYKWAEDNRTLQVVHTWKDEITKQPTCTEVGETTQTCTVCGATQTVEIKALGHEWSNPVILFAENGTSAKAIWVCGRDDSHVVAVDCTVKSEVTTKATCTTAEVTTYTAVAKVDGMPEGSATTTRTTKEALGHKWGEWTIAQTATCEAAGLEKRVCENDTNHVEEQAIPATGHAYGKPAIKFAEDGKTATATWACTNANCTHAVTKDCTVTFAVTKEATCTEAGETTYTATIDADVTLGLANGTSTKTVADIPALKHDIVEDAAVPATCETPGKKAGTHCSRCDYATGGEEIEALGHKWGEAEVVPDADMSSATATWTCENDKNHKRVVLCPVLKTVKKAATCTAPGEYIYTATAMIDNKTLLSKELKTEKMPATGHHFDGLTCTDCKVQLGDVNGNGTVNIVDAQMAYDIATKGAYKDLDAYAAYCSAADVTGTNDGKPDGRVDAIDAFRIQYVIHNGWSVEA